MHEDQDEALARGEVAEPPSEVRRVEEAHRGRSGRRQTRDHAQDLHRVANPRHLEAGAERCDTLPLARLVVGARQRADGDVVVGSEMPDDVERPDLAAPLGREWEPVADEQDLHGVASAARTGAANDFSSAATSAGERRSRKILAQTSRFTSARSRSVPSIRLAWWSATSCATASWRRRSRAPSACGEKRRRMTG